MHIQRTLLLILIISLICFCFTAAIAQTISPPWGNAWWIVSDFGPRDVTTGTWFHKGVDYSAAPYDQDFGTPIPAVEGGIVKAIIATSPYYIRISSANSVWDYFHIFANNNFIVMDWELRVNAQLVNPNDITDIQLRNVVILWSGNRAVKVLCADYPGYWVQEGTGYIQDTDGNRITTRNTVVAGESIAPMGNSNPETIYTHLHLGLNYADDNPLAHLIHSPDALPTVTIESPPNNYLLKGAELHSNYPIKVSVDSTNGPDLDKVEFWVYRNNDPNQAIPLGSTKPTFSYGGKVAESFTMSAQTPSDGTTTGVQPYSVSGDSLGHDRFVLLQNFSTLPLPGGATLPSGQHSLVVRATDVNGNSTPVVIQRFTLQNPELDSGYVNPPSGDANTDFYYYVYYYDPCGNAPATAYVYIDGTPHAMTLYGGTAADGSYVFGPIRLSAATHNYFFNFTDGQGGTAWLPYSGTSPGPTIASYTLTASVSPSGGGTITATGINCPSDCSESYAVGTNVTLTAAPSSGYKLGSWSGCDSSSGTQCSVTMNSSKSVSASFNSTTPPEGLWAKNYGGSSSDGVRSVQQTSDGGFIVAGMTASFSSSADVWVFKLNSGGDIQWQYAYGGSNYNEAKSIKEASDGYYIMAGVKASSSTNSDIWILKLNANDGTIVWQKTYGGSGYDEATSIELASDGNYIVAGTTGSFGSGWYDVWILKLNANDGTIIWQKTYGGSSSDDRVASIHRTSDGGYIVAGDAYSSSRLTDAWVMKLDTYGNVQWQYAYGGSNYEVANSAHQTSDGGYIVAGTTFTNLGFYGAWVMKLDQYGNIAWQKVYGSSSSDTNYEAANSIQQTSDGGYIVAGETVYFYATSNYDAWVMKLDAYGNIQWQKAYTGKYNDAAYSVQQIPDGYIAAGIYTFEKIVGGNILAEINAGVWKIDNSGNIGSNCSNIKIPQVITLYSSNFTRINPNAAVTNTNVSPYASSGLKTNTSVIPGTQCSANILKPNILVTPTALNFGSINAGSSTAQIVTVLNTGTSNLSISSINISGTNAAEFSQTNNCSTVASGGSCSVTVTFSPTAFGQKMATVNISSNDPDTPTEYVSLSGSSGHSLTVSQSGSGAGTVTSAPSGINCGGDCTEKYNHGTVITLTATPGQNSIFAGWSGTACSGTHDCSVALNADMTVTAVFNLIPPVADFDASFTFGVFPLTVSFTDMSISNPTSWRWDFGDGTTSTLQNPTHTFAHVGEYTVSLSVTNAVGSDSESKNNYIIVTNYITYTFTASAGTGGSISPSGTVGVIQGSNQTFTITPTTGYHIADVLVDGISAGPVAAYTFTNIMSNHSISASFARNTYTITATAGAGGSISPSGTVTVNHGANQTYSITPDTGYYIADVRIDGRSAGAPATFTFTNVTANHTIAASFSNATTHTITATAGAGGSISPSGTVSVNYGASRTFTITPDAGYHVTDVRVDGESVGTVGAYTFISVTTGHTIEASFSNTYILTITKSGAGTGTVTSSPTGINCGADCTEAYAPDTVVTLSAAPDSNTAFSGWSGACTGASTTCTVTMSAAKTVTASFGIITAPNIAVSPAALNFGRVDIGSSKSLTLTISNMGTTSLAVNSIDITGANANEFAQTNNCSSIASGGSCSITVTFISIFLGVKNATLAISSNDPDTPTQSVVLSGTVGYTLTVTNSGAGIGVVTNSSGNINCGTNCIDAYNQGTAVTLTATPDTGSFFVGWSGGGCSGTGDCTVTLNTDTMVTAKFTFTSCPSPPVRIAGTTPTYYSSLQAAYDAAADGDVIQSLAVNFAENLSINRNIAVTLEGGYRCDYTASTENTTLQGIMATSAGTLTIAKFQIVSASPDTTHSIVAIADIGGSITPSGTLLVSNGTSQTYNITPDSGYTIVNVLVDGASAGAVSTYTFTDITANHTIQAIFSRTLTVIKSGTGSGTVTSSPVGIACGADCSEQYAHGAVITLAAAPEAGSFFAGWSGGGCSGTGTCTVTMNADTTVTATFSITPPMADFSCSPTSGIETLTVNCTDLSTNNPSSWLWDFGDGTTSTLKNPSHTYNAIGVYTVSLTATNIGGSDPAAKTDYITIQPCPNQPVRIAGATPDYPTLQAAYDAAADGAVIQSRNLTFAENLNVNRNISITLEGGYGCDYTSAVGATALKGMITTSAGTLTIKDFILQQ